MAQKIDELEFGYDADADVMYISFGPPRPAISDEDHYGHLIRRDPHTHEIIGITILDFSRETKEQISEITTESLKKLARTILSHQSAKTVGAPEHAN